VLHPRFLEATATLPSVSHRIGFSVLGLLAGMPTDYLPTYWSHLHDRRSRRRLRDLSRQLNREARAPYEPARLGCPVLLLWGDRDRFSLPSGARALLETYPDARLEVLPGAGHCPQLQVPDPIADLLLALP
jgi:pimeloyl-ACP methyl ester carboxylesterase